MHVFISHSRVNSSSAFRLCDELRHRGVDTWLDIRDLQPGAEWKEGVTAAIEAAAAFVFLLGPPGPSDRWQTFEWQHVVDQEFYLDPSKPLIPVLIGNPDLPGFLKIYKSYSLGDSPDACIQLADQIVAALKNPESSLDAGKLEVSVQARRSARDNYRAYSKSLVEDVLKQTDSKTPE